MGKTCSDELRSNLAVNEGNWLSSSTLKEKDGDTTTLMQGRKGLYAITFIVLGTAQLFYWNGLLNILGDVKDTYYPHRENLSNFLTANYHTCNFVCSLLLTWKGYLSFTLSYAAGIAFVIVHVLTPVLINNVEGDASIAFLHIVVAVAGCAGGLWQSGQYALASTMPEVMAGWVSAGNGVSGIVTFALWMLFSEALFKHSTFKCLWWTMGTGACLCLVGVVATAVMRRRPDIRTNMAKLKAHSVEDPSATASVTYREVFRLMWPYALGVFLVFFGTLVVYPAIAPFRWSVGGSTRLNILVGMFQVGDCLGRFFTLISFIPFALLPKATLPFFVVGRYVLVAIAIIMWKTPGRSGYQNFGFQLFWMFILSFTNGWVGTSAFVRGPQSIEQPAHRARAATIAVMGVLLGIVAGLWTGNLVTIRS